jgi:hypothetical protein
MSDERMVVTARELARYLILFARERRDEDRKRIAELQTELCTLYREEQTRLAQDQDEGTPA